MATKEEIQERLEAFPGLAGNYKEILNALTAVDEKDADVKLSENELKENAAGAMSLYKKDGTTLDTGKITMKTLVGAIEVHSGIENKLEIEYEKQEEYISLIKQGDIEKGPIDKYVRNLNEKKELVSEAKDVINSLKERIDVDIVACLHEIAKEEAKLIKESKMEKPPKPKKDDKGIDAFEIIKVLKEKLGKQ